MLAKWREGANFMTVLIVLPILCEIGLPSSAGKFDPALLNFTVGWNMNEAN